MNNPLVGPAKPSEKSATPQQKGPAARLISSAARGKRARVAMGFMASAGIMLLCFVLFATWHNGGLDPAAAPIDTAWAEQTFDKVLVAFLGMLAFTRASAVR